MRAAVFHGPRDVRVEQRSAPTDPGRGEVVVRVARASVCGTDAAEWDHGPVLVRGAPRTLGHEFVGEVIAAGPGVALRAGSRVVTGAGVWCGACARCAEGRTNLCDSYYTLGLHADGGLAERALVPAATCVEVPDGCSDDAAALAQPMAVALHALRRGGPARTILIHGAGGIGAFAVAGAAFRRADMVIAVDVDRQRLHRAGALGAHHVIDARSSDVVPTVRALTGDRGVDVALETSGAPSGPGTCLSATRTGGRVVVVGLQPQPVAVDLLDATLREVDLVPSLAHVFASDLPEALAALADGRVAEHMIDRVISLDELVGGALEKLARGAIAGKVLVDPARPAAVTVPGDTLAP